MNQPLEPSYLRYVYDNLKKGSLNTDNASALPQGFIGLYEQEFEANIPVHKRQEVVQQLATFALLKTAVSGRFVASILDTEEEIIEALIQNNSTWFNSPESGIYVLYHDRLRIYLLQKLSKTEVLRLNEQIIAVLEKSIETQKTDESEYYALQHLAGHMSLASQLGKDYERLHRFVNQESLWQRQIKLSKGYEWSQHAVHQGIKEGARRQHEMNTIRSTVNSVKLMTQEQNSAEDILNLLNEGDYITALKRAETWEGERQFKLYLLLVHELTIGTSKEADFRKEACKAVLEAIEQIPEDHSVLDWCKFYPELAIYKYHEEFLDMELDGMVIWKRGEYTLKDISEWTDLNIEIIKSLASEITDACHKSKAYGELSKILMEHGKMKESQEGIKESLRVASEITDARDKSLAYRELSKILMEQGKIKESLKLASEITREYDKLKAFASIFWILIDHREKEESKKVMEEILRADFNIIDEYHKSEVYAIKSEIFFELGEKDEAQKAILEALRVVSHMKFEFLRQNKNNAFRAISKIIMQQGKKEEALRVVSEITDEFYKSLAYVNIYEVLMEKGENYQAKKVMLEALSAASIIKENFDKSLAYSIISKILMSHGEKEEAKKSMKEAIREASGIIEIEKSKIYANLAKIFMEQGEKEDVKNVMKESLTVRSKKGYRYATLMDILEKLIVQGKEEEAKIAIKECHRSTSQIKDKYIKSYLYAMISEILMKLNEIEESLNIASEITDAREKSRAYKELSKILLEQGKIKESLKVASEITNAWDKSKAYGALSKILMEQGKMKESIRIVSKISLWCRTEACGELSKILLKQGKIKESLKIASEIIDEYDKSKAYGELSKILLEQGKIKESQEVIEEYLKAASEITYDRRKSIAYASFSKIILEQGKIKESNEVIKESIKLASEITDEYDKSAAFFSISKILLEQEKIKESLKIASEIIDEYDKSKAYLEISKKLMEQGKMKESLKVTSEITDSWDKSIAYRELSKILIGQGKMIKSLELVDNIEPGSETIKTLLEFGKTLSFKEAQNLLPLIPSEENQSAMIKGMSENIYEQMELSEAIYPYLYHHSRYTENLCNILFHQAKIACFFEEDRNEVKLDMLSDVLDIKDWRRISA